MIYSVLVSSPVAVQCSLTCFQVAQHKLCGGVPVPALHLPAHTLAGRSSTSHIHVIYVSIYVYYL